jgi:DNA repair exonuclease SbcCD ATPase subunit
MRRNLFILASVLLLSGCLAQSKIQSRYNVQQGECRDVAESNIGRYEATAADERDRNAQLVTIFSDCMAKKGWQVAKPRRTTTSGPHGPLDPYGSSAAVAAAKTQPTSAGPDTERVMQKPPGNEPATAGEVKPLTMEQYRAEQQKLIQRQQELEQQQQQLRQQQQNMQQQQPQQQNNQQQQPAESTRDIQQKQLQLQQQQQDIQSEQLRLQQRMYEQQQEQMRRTQQYQQNPQYQQNQQNYQYPYQQPQTQAPLGQSPVKTTTTPLSPSGGMPPLSRPADTPAHYMPGRNF